MSRKDYELIAQAFADTITALEDKGRYERAQGVSEAAWVLSKRLRHENIRFDRERFLKAAKALWPTRSLEEAEQRREELA